MAVDALAALKLSLAAASAGVYSYVGTRLWNRRVEGPGRLAARLFAAWWVLLGGISAVSVGMGFLAAAGVADLALYLTIIEVYFLLLCVALWALLYYLVYVLTGSRRAVVPIATFYALFYVWILYLITSIHPQAVKIVDLSYRLDPQPQTSPAVTGVLLSLLLGPVLVAAVGYFRLFFRVEGRTQRYRIGLIAITLLAWFGSSGVAAVVGVSNEPWWGAVNSVLGLAAAVSIYFAYQPPSYVRRRFGIAAVGEETRA